MRICQELPRITKQEYQKNYTNQLLENFEKEKYTHL